MGKDKKIGVKEIITILLILVIIGMGVLYFTKPDAFDKMSEIIKDLSSLGDVDIEVDIPKTELKVTFDANGGEVNKTEKNVLHLENYGALPVPTRKNAEFLGWYTERNGGVQVKAENTVTSSSNHTLYARWAVDVTFDYNGGISGNETKKVIIDSTYGTLPEPKKENFSFEGWYTERDGGERITATSTVNIGGAHTLYARWKSNEYTVIFDTDGGVIDVDSINVSYGSEYGNLPVPKKANAEFIGWFTSPTGKNEITSESVVEATSSHTLYARWLYTVRFDSNGGTNVADITVVGGFTYGDLAVPTKENYEFVGWFDSLIGGSEITAETIVESSGHHTLYARWIGKSYIVSFDANDGETVLKSITVIYGSEYGDLPILEKENAEFIGWFTAPLGGTEITSDTVLEKAESHTLYAQWTITITFDFCNGRFDDESKTVVYGSTYGELPEPGSDELLPLDLSFNGYEFVGWFTEPTGGVQVTSDTVVDLLYNHTLYAHWKAPSNIV